MTKLIISVQFKKNDGKCGVCGDDWSLERPRENENGGKYGTGTISRTYVQGQVIEVEVELTTNHWGWFEMKLCPVNDKLGLEDDKCMDKHPLNLANEDSTKFFIPKDSKKKDTFKYKIKLPNNVVCSQCVLQWTYWTGLNFRAQKYYRFNFYLIVNFLNFRAKNVFFFTISSLLHFALFSNSSITTVGVF